jgi:hypothetical protein
MQNSPKSQADIKDYPEISPHSADRKVSSGYGFTTAPECKNYISARQHLPVTPCNITIFALLRKLSDLLTLLLKITVSI